MPYRYTCRDAVPNYWDRLHAPDLALVAMVLQPQSIGDFPSDHFIYMYWYKYACATLHKLMLVVCGNR